MVEPAEKHYSLKKAKYYFFAALFCLLAFLGDKGLELDAAAIEQLSLPFSKSAFDTVSLFMIIIGALLAMATTKLIFEHPTGLTVAPWGLLDRSGMFWPVRTILWSDIRSIGEHKERGKEMILLHVYDEEKFAGFNAFQRRISRNRVAVSGTSVYIHSSRLKADHQELVTQMRRGLAVSRVVS